MKSQPSTHVLRRIPSPCPYLDIPTLDRQRVCDGQPIAMNLEVCRFADDFVLPTPSRAQVFKAARHGRSSTYYAGKRRILKAAETMAHCVRDGCMSAICRDAGRPSQVGLCVLLPQIFVDKQLTPTRPF